MTATGSSAGAEPTTRFAVGGRDVARLGYGAMQITGPGVWGPPEDPAQARAVLRQAVELGVELIDTADSYGPAVSEELIAEALHPYPDNLVVATKAGFARTGPGRWTVLGFPEYLTQQCELSLRRLKLERIELFQLHRIDARLPLAEQLGALTELQAAGKIGQIGLSEVTVDQLEQARQICPIATVQNLYNLGNRAAEQVLQACEAAGIGFIPWFPLQTGQLMSADADTAQPLAELARRVGHSPAQLALAWLLQRSPIMLPIPGTSSLAHLEENMDAATIILDADVVAELDAVSRRGGETAGD